MDRASLEIITGRIESDAESSKVFAVVRDQDGRAKQHVQALLRQRGRDTIVKQIITMAEQIYAPGNAYIDRSLTY